MKENECKKLVMHFFAGAVILLGAFALIVFLFDPFFHYHKPWFGLAAVQDSKEYQVPGVVEHVEYDSVLLGSSVVMSINTDTLDQRFSCKTVKAVGNSATAPLLNYYLNHALETHDLKYVFYGLDVYSFYCDPDAEVISNDVKYLTNQNPFDDVKYLWNGEVIGKKIPDMLKKSLAGNYSWGMAYNLNQYAMCGPDAALGSYSPYGLIPEPEKSWDYEWEYVEENIDRLEETVMNHPGTEFLFCMPPYPILWWTRAYNEGMMVTYEHTLKTCMERLLQYENVRFYTTDFNNIAVITDLYQYMDVIHGGAMVTDRMAQELGDPQQEITLENYEEELARLEEILNCFLEKVDAEGIGFLYGTGGMKID